MEKIRYNLISFIEKLYRGQKIEYTLKNLAARQMHITFFFN